MSGEPWRLGKLTRTRENGTRYWSFCVKWDDERGAHRVSLDTVERSTAEAKASEFWAKRTLTATDTIGEIVTAYMATQAGKRGEKRKKEAWTAAKGFWSSIKPAHVIPDVAGQKGTGAAYIAQRNRAANTIRNELGLINTALHWAKDSGHIPVVPKIRLPAMPESEVEHLTKAQFRRFLKGCRAPHVKLFVQLAIATGARATALLELPWLRVDFERRQINLNPAGREQIGNKRRATVPITDKLLPLLTEARACALSPFVIELGAERILSIRKGFEAASARSGVHCTPHMLRHSAAVWMAEERVPMAEIAAYLGHKNTRITEKVYARFSPDYLNRAAKALNW